MSFLTGSRVYGEPKPDSDIDLVVSPLSSSEYSKLAQFADKDMEIQKHEPSGHPNLGHKSLRFGKLNLIIPADFDQYSAWAVGTRNLHLRSVIENRKIGREEAIAVFTKLRRLLRGDKDGSKDTESKDQSGSGDDKSEDLSKMLESI